MIILKKAGKNKLIEKIKGFFFKLELIDNDWILTIKCLVILFQINISASIRNLKK